MIAEGRDALGRYWAGWARRWLVVVGIAILLVTAGIMWWLAPMTADGLGVAEMAWRAVIDPYHAFERLAASAESASFGWWFALGCAALYSGTAALLAGRGFIPDRTPLLPIPAKDYYAWQTLFTLPAGITFTGLGCVAAFGVAHMLGSDVALGALWGPFAVAIVVPTTICMWLPETVCPFFAGAGATTAPFPKRFNLGRIILGSVWAALLGIVALAATGAGVVVSILGGIVGAVVVGGMPVVLR